MFVSKSTLSAVVKKGLNSSLLDSLSAYIKAAFLSDITTEKTSSPYIDKKEAVKILGTMLGGYNIEPLIKCPVFFFPRY